MMAIRRFPDKEGKNVPSVNATLWLQGRRDGGGGDVVEAY